MPIEPATTSFATYPNPFTNRTTINITLPESSVAEISIVNLLGKEVAKLFSGELAVGQHAFTWDANGVPAGMYQCVVRRGEGLEQLPILLLR
jgi:hypothetical protein